MIIHPFVLLGSSQLTQLQQSLLVEIRDWGMAWTGKAVAPELRISHLENSDETEGTGDVVLKVEGNDTHEWVICTYNLEKMYGLASIFLQIEEIKNRVSSGTELTVGLVRESLLDLAGRFLPAIALEAATITQGASADYLMPEKSSRPGNGLLQLHIDIESVSVMFCLPQSALLSRLSSEITAEKKNRENG